MRSFLIVLALVLGSTTGLVAQDSAPTPPPLMQGVPVPAGAIAVIDGRLVTIREVVDAVYDRFRNHVQGQETLNNLLQQRIITHHLKARNITVTKEQIQSKYDELDRQVRAANEDKKTIAEYLEERKLSRQQLEEQLYYFVGLHVMAQQDFEREEILPADHVQWIRSKTLDADIERDPAKLPQDAAGRVYGEFVTRQDFARALVGHLPRDEVVTIVQSMMQAILAENLLTSAGGTIRSSDAQEQWEGMRSRFENDPKFQGLSFEDFIREREGMSREQHIASSGFRREMCLNLLGPTLVPDAEVPKAYAADLDHYGPIYTLSHVLVRGSDQEKDRKLVRDMNAAKSEAEKIVAKLEKGESFDACVKLYSEDAKTKFRGGEIGEYSPLMLDEQGLRRQVEATPVGSHFGPVQDKLGYHVFLVAGKRPAPPLSPEITQDIRLRRARDAFMSAWRDAKRGYDLRPIVNESR